TNEALATLIAHALERSGLPREAIQVIPFTDRDSVRALVQESEYVDLAIPRGGEALIRFVTEHARVPVVQHYKGVCHLFVGGELGLGAEIGIATSRLHWRGPMGIESLTTMKWVIDGDGQTR